MLLGLAWTFFLVLDIIKDMKRRRGGDWLDNFNDQDFPPGLN